MDSGRTLLLVIALSVSACAFFRDPLDPLDALDHRAVREIGSAEQSARGRAAYERARRRIDTVKPGMSAAEVEVAMRAAVVTEQVSEDVADDAAPRRKLVDGLLCKVTKGLHQRWLFGYDEDKVELVGFAVQFEREDEESEDWEVAIVDREPADDCPDSVVGTH
jgi:hypothetical protein